MTNNYDRARDIIEPAILQAYEEGFLTKVEYEVVRGSLSDSLDDLLEDYTSTQKGNI